VDDELDEEPEDDPPLELEAGTVVVVVAPDVAVVAVVSATRTAGVGVALNAARLTEAWDSTS
jgi:hypothetical protein